MINKQIFSKKPRFILRDNLGKLARYLRLLGYDSVLYPKISFYNVLRIATKDRRIILTRSPKEFRKKSDYRIILIKSIFYEKQLKELKGIIEFNDDFFGTRCSLCNQVLETAPLNYVKEKVPVKILENSHYFLICKKCGRIYWQGKHFKDIQERLVKIL